ncbi:TPA: hypothetical protein ACMDPN_000762 [Vibrio cholerae]|uniref:hypothetical protein n=1 Tax=Vibrio cholerae TaxID=666 RepID=UPI0029DAD86F|nr:hypothetical protein [Vibrio cholerae]EJL6422899.1 hypothetical protein [Vibrio cholerae]EKF9638761.1 hypothetical protein [Vibrio cholerae]EKF9815781.1 hypothetical protein [Vibrio cholerae]HEJ2460839.1 hypothetical protein [Vibrio cholerae]
MLNVLSVEPLPSTPIAREIPRSIKVVQVNEKHQIRVKKMLTSSVNSTCHKLLSKKKYSIRKPEIKKRKS